MNLGLAVRIFGRKLYGDPREQAEAWSPLQVQGTCPNGNDDSDMNGHTKSRADVGRDQRVVLWWCIEVGKKALETKLRKVRTFPALR